MYFVKYGYEYLHDPRVDGYILLDLSLDAEENSCGYCDFTINPSHPMYSKIKEQDTDNPVEVYDGDILLFSGFIYELGVAFYLSGQVKCKGELSYLNESIVRPYSTHTRGYGDKAPTTINGYFEWLIEQHNNQVNPNKQFVVGINQGGCLDSNNYLFRESNQYPKTSDEITEKLLNSLGGYLVSRHEEGIRYIDYLAEWTESNTQILDFGINLTDYTQTDDSSEIATFIVPRGARMSDTEYQYCDGYLVTSDNVPDPNKEYYVRTENGYSKCNDLIAFEEGVVYYVYYEDWDESGLNLTIAGLVDFTYEDDFKKTGDMVYCESAVRKYGWIGANYENSDITEMENLLDKGVIALKELISPKRTIEIKAVDMHLINPNIKPIRVGEYVRVRSMPHKLDSYFLCTNISLDLNNPENSLYTLGTTYDTLTGQQNKRINKLNETINGKYEAAAAISEEAKKAAENAKTIVGSAVTNVVEEFAISNSETTAPEEGWSTTSPERTPGTYIWHRMTTTYGNGTIEYGIPSVVSGANGQNGEDAVVLRIDSSRGTVFKNSSISTVLTVTIYKGSQVITNITELHSVFGLDAYLEWSWEKIDESEFGVIVASDPMIQNDGFTLVVSSEQVDGKCTFACKLKN